MNSIAVSAAAALANWPGFETVDRRKIEAALAGLLCNPLTDPASSELTLRAGETFFVDNHEGGERDQFSTRAELDRYLNQVADDHELAESYRTLDDLVDVFIVRKKVTVASQKVFNITLS